MGRRLVIYWSCDGSRSMGQSGASGDFEGPSLSPCRTVLRLVLETLLEPSKQKVCTFCLRRETLPAVATCLPVSCLCAALADASAGECVATSAVRQNGLGHVQCAV